MKIKISSIAKYLFYFIILLDTFLPSMFNITFGNNKNTIAIVCSILFILYIYIWKKTKIANCCRFINIYMILVVCMLFFHYIYAMWNNIQVGAFLHNALFYLIAVLAYPIIIYIKSTKKEDDIFDTLNMISLFWNLWLLLQFVLYQYNGTILSNLSASANSIRNGSIRIGMSCIGHLMIIYNFDLLYNKRNILHKKKPLLMLIIGIATMLLVEQTRGYYIAVFGAIAALVIIYNKSSKKFLLTSIVTIGGITFLASNRIISRFIETVFDPGRSYSSGATGLIRLEGMKLFWERFTVNPLWGYGFQSTNDAVVISGFMYYFNDNGFIGIIGQIGIWAFIIYGFMLARLGFITFRLLKENDYARGTLLLGFYVYLILTSISLICYWGSTCLLCPILWAVFETKYYNHKANNAYDI